MLTSMGTAELNKLFCRVLLYFYKIIKGLHLFVGFLSLQSFQSKLLGECFMVFETVGNMLKFPCESSPNSRKAAVLGFNSILLIVLSKSGEITNHLGYS